MNAAYPFRYLRAYARYMEFDEALLVSLLGTAVSQAAPGDTYAQAADGRWLTLSELTQQANRGSIIASYTRQKVLEYAGESPPADPSPTALKRLRAL